HDQAGAGDLLHRLVLDLLEELLRGTLLVVHLVDRARVAGQLLDRDEEIKDQKSFLAGRIVPDGLTSMSFICRSRVTRRGEPGGQLNPRALRALDRASSVTGCPRASSSRSTATISSDGAGCGALADPRCARAAVLTPRLPVLRR